MQHLNCTERVHNLRISHCNATQLQHLISEVRGFLVSYKSSWEPRDIQTKTNTWQRYSQSRRVKSELKNSWLNTEILNHYWSDPEWRAFSLTFEPVTRKNKVKVRAHFYNWGPELHQNTFVSGFLFTKQTMYRLLWHLCINIHKPYRHKHIIVLLRHP